MAASMQQLMKNNRQRLVLLSLILVWLWCSPLIGVWQKPLQVGGVPLFFLGVIGSWALAIVLIFALTKNRSTDRTKSRRT